MNLVEPSVGDGIAGIVNTRNLVIVGVALPRITKLANGISVSLQAQVFLRHRDGMVDRVRDSAQIARSGAMPSRTAKAVYDGQASTPQAFYVV